MSIFRTSIPQVAFPLAFSHTQPTLCVGSCFAENIGQKLTDHKFSTIVNPLGILYNPYSIGNALDYLIKGDFFEEKDLFSNNGLYHSFDHHGGFSMPNPSETIRNINNELHRGSIFLKSTKRLILTFGTSNVFVYKKTGQIVANCHKMPNQEFERKALSVDHILERLRPVFRQLKSAIPDLEVLLTVSPVRHIRDGHIENQRSKARLLLACEQLCKDFDFAHYFPSYEILMDDLRDYRFYAADMIHPNEVAINYIWGYFSQCFFNEETKELNSKINKIVNATKHRPFHQKSPAHQGFIAKQIQLIEQMQVANNFLDFESELIELKSQLD